MRMPRAAILLLAAWALSSVALAQVFKWTDADGKVRYGDKPPEGVRSSAVEDRTNAHGTVKGEAKAGTEADKRHKMRMAELDKDLTKRKASAGKEQVAEAKRREAYEQCTASRRTDCQDVLSGKAATPATTPRHVVGAGQPKPVQPVPPPKPAQQKLPASSTVR